MEELTISLDERNIKNLEVLANREHISLEELVTNVVTNFAEDEIYKLWVL